MSVVRFYNRRGTAEQWIKEGKNAVKWTKLSCRRFQDNAARLQLFALVYNLANFLRQLVLPKPIKGWTLTTLREKLIKIGAKVVRHSKYVIFQLAEVAVPRKLFAAILGRIGRLRLACASGLGWPRPTGGSERRRRESAVCLAARFQGIRGGKEPGAVASGSRRARPGGRHGGGMVASGPSCR